MIQFEKVTLFLFRISLGWLLFYAGITKLLDPSWTAEGYLKGAKTLTGLYQFFASPAVLPFTNFLNAWGLTLIGLSLLVGIGVRLSAILGAAIMLLYYLPILQFPYPNAHSFIVDEHIVYAAALLFLAATRAGRVWGLETWCASLPLCAKFPRLRAWWG